MNPRHLIAVLVLVLLPHLAVAATVSHPFILWTKDEAAQLRKKVESEPWAKAEYQKNVLAQRGNGKGAGIIGTVVNNLFRYSVMGDAQIGQAEKKDLLSFVGTPTGGKLNSRPWTDHYLTVLRYDVLYDLLTPDERQKVETTMRAHVQNEIDNDQRTYTKLAWLPNMQWPHKISAHLMAAALQDEKLMRGIAEGNGGWKYYFDDYLSDGSLSLYNEEFGKQYSLMGEMLLWCRACKRLGLDELGAGYTGKHGATMQAYLYSYVMLGYPRIDLGGDRPRYPMVATGDHRAVYHPGGYLAQAALVPGYWPDGEVGVTSGSIGRSNPRWLGLNMNGRDHKDRIVDKMLTPLWFEMAHQQWPDAHFDYFLAQMRPPEQDKYYPSLYFSLSPIDPAAVKAPLAPSWVAPERGVVMLRADESSRYWEGPLPAVSMSLASEYVHHVHDAFAISGFYAFNRPIYLNRQIVHNYAEKEWSGSIRSHCGLMVNGQEPRFIGPVPLRSDFGPLVKFAAARGVGIHRLGASAAEEPQPRAAQDDGDVPVVSPAASQPAGPAVTQTRALFLSAQYLLDVFDVSAPQPCDYVWLIHALGQARPDEPAAWKPTEELTKLVYPLEQQKALAPTRETWSLTMLQTCTAPDPAQSVVGTKWFEKQVGVRLTMLGQDETRAYYADTPLIGRSFARTEADKAKAPNAFGGVTVAVHRHAASTTFVALHEPFAGGQSRIARVDRIAQIPQGVAVSVTGRDGTGIDDRLLLQTGEGVEKPLTLEGNGERYTFVDHAFLRISGDTVEASGDLRAARVKVNGNPRLKLNGKDAPAIIQGGYLVYEPATETKR